MEVYLGAMSGQVDSSLLDEWSGCAIQISAGRNEGITSTWRGCLLTDITRDTKVFTAAIRNRIFGFPRGLVIGDYETAIATLNSPAMPRASRDGGAIDAAVEAYYVGHERICPGSRRRATPDTPLPQPAEDKKTRRVQQMLVNLEGDNDWVAEFEVDLRNPRALNESFLRLRRIGSWSKRPESVQTPPPEMRDAKARAFWLIRATFNFPAVGEHDLLHHAACARAFCVVVSKV